MFHPAVAAWFDARFAAPTRAQALAWPPIARGDSTLLLAPTGSGKTLAAFLACIDRLMFAPAPPPKQRCRVLYVSPLKALATDVERNLRAPIAGIAQVAAARGDTFVIPELWVRTGDTPSQERVRFLRRAPDILITTPESLYLMLTSNAAAQLRAVDTVIIDEIHALVPTKRGAHLMLSLERLEALCERRVQRIGLSATQRPLDEVARFLGGFERDGATRPVTIADAGAVKRLALRVETPLEDMTMSAESPDGSAPSSIWAAIHPRLLDLVRAHGSTLIFVNSRRIAERLAGAINELAGETLVYAHHGSVARPQRLEIEERLKRGAVRGLVATSSLELGIDMGAIDLVVQIEAPPSVASGLQRIGRANHQVGGVSEGVIFPKFRADLLACAALTRAMHEGKVEATRAPKNALDVLAQQIVAMAAMRAWPTDELFARLRQAAPFSELTPALFEGVLDMLSGRYASDDFAELRPRITWDRVAKLIKARDGSKRIAIASGGTIPDRGLYGVFLAGAKTTAAGRIGELDEEMVFETKRGETFVLGASTWRVEEVTHDRVLVSPAPGEPGKMPFWRGEQPLRPYEVGARIGAFTRELLAFDAKTATARLTEEHDLDAAAAANLLAYLGDQQTRGAAVPDDRTILVERHKDELGAWRVCVLTPYGGQVHMPWSMIAVLRVKEHAGLDVESMWTNDGFVVRFPESDVPPDADLLIPTPAEIEPMLLEQLGATALFAAKFRENAARALLLPRRRPGSRTPLWQQRKRAADLLAVAARHPSFPILLETYRECMRDLFDVPALHALLTQIARQETRVVVAEAAAPSPFAAALMFGFVANYLYDGDAPLQERRAQALTIDRAQLKELLGEAELRELLDADAIAEVEARVRLTAYPPKSADQLNDLLLRLGDLSRPELDERGVDAAWLRELVAERRVVPLQIAGEERFVAVEDAARYRDALGVSLPPGLPRVLLGPAADPLLGLAQRYARTHAPFTVRALADRYALPPAVAADVLQSLVRGGRLLEGEFLPGGSGRELSDPEILAQIRRRSLQKLRQAIEPVPPAAYARLLTSWQGVATWLHGKPRFVRRGLDALLDTIEQLQGAPLVASAIERDILPARIDGYAAADLDALCAAGEVVCVGVEPLGDRDGRVAFYLSDHLPRLWSPPVAAELPPDEARIVAHLEANGASFSLSIARAQGGGFMPDLTAALWRLFFRGVVVNDTFRALRTFMRTSKKTKRGRDRAAPAFRSRRAAPLAGDGRWSLVAARALPRPSDSVRALAIAEQLLRRYGVVTREVAQLEGIGGGFSAVYDVLRTLEDQGRVRRGYFVGEVAAMQFAVPAAIERLRALREVGDAVELARLAATDPANPYGALLPWPVPGLTRSAGAEVVIAGGRLLAYLPRGAKAIHVFLPEREPERSRDGTLLAAALLQDRAQGRRLVVEQINGARAVEHPFALYLADAGFVASSLGFVAR
ncbi:MAG: DEAD/DEAH box helicase [Deltaproteobacteria bacterium]|nr:DEAD/DEAH box helicase [Deltaproteobacteria bacterium]